MLTFRPVTWTDACPLYTWRHDEETIKWSLKPPPTWDEHLRWMNEVISSPSLQRIGVMGSIPVVAAQWLPDGIRVMTNPLQRGKGFATEAIKHFQEQLDYLVAIIKFGNEASMNLFKKCGFMIVSYNNVGQPNETITMEWEQP